MMISAITQRGTIKGGHLVRKEFADQSTGSQCYKGGVGCYQTKGCAACTFNDVLQGYGLYMDRDDLNDFQGNEGRKMIAVYSKENGRVGYAVLSWYRKHSGNYEFNGYLT